MALIELRNVRKVFPTTQTPALDNVSVTVHEGERVAVVGQSGSGKTTLLNIALGFTSATSGAVQTADPHTTGLVFQNPITSLDPRWKVCDIVREGKSGSSYEEVREALENVSLDPDVVMDRYISDISGGQAQRVAIARALISEPKLLVADEPVSAVDVLGKQYIIDTFQHAHEERGLAMLIVLHDLGVAQKLSDTIVVMHEGKIVEHGDTQQVLTHPEHSYTKKLIEAARW
ncbi:ATP-binding cassette domain-containing protein [Alloscardovia theropitheci]|uniref:ATP-binding cassette domain-containing protein n=1 Tax=Alloscardovia theropitheci TaxID=2496842 RepID=A0A4R0QTV4_9BIFI|nr:ATP-binding cassette domain-containing protein [Alloscardovia theropitheci]TCD54978.1 ATP-binding cassette domain-containing protein [Alloscardovia theropitheci]